MYSHRIVKQVKRKRKGLSGVLKVIMIFFAVIFVLMGIVFSRGFMLPGFLMAALYFVYDIFVQKDYEYILENGKLIIYVIYGKRYRKKKHDLNLQELEIVAPNWHGAVAKYRIKGGTVRLPKYDYTSYDDKIPYYTMIIQEGKKKIKLLLDLDHEMLSVIRHSYPDKVIME